MTSPHLAGVLIVRDEARCLGRCLTSLRPWVDEIVVLDTGSIDDTVLIARQHGARIGSFAWCDDFAAARNAALDAADADWSLILDADEWLECGGENLRPFTSAGVGVGLAGVRSSLEIDGRIVHSMVVSERLLPRGVRYTGRVHEQPVHRLPAGDVGLLIGHDGYSPGPAERKLGRNEKLVRRELVDRPGDPYLRYQLGKELAALGNVAEAAEAFEEALRVAPATVPYRHALVIAALSALTRTGRLDAALRLAEDEYPQWPDSPDLHFMMGNLFLDISIADPRAAATLLPMIEATWLRCLEIGDRPDLPGSVAGRGSHFAARNLSAYYSSLGRPEEAARYDRLDHVGPSAGTTGDFPLKPARVSR